MPSDIRSFFGGRSTEPPAQKPKEPEKPKKRGRGRKVIDDDEEDGDDEPVTKKSTTKSAAARKPDPVLEETTADDFFGKDNKPKRSAAVSSKSKAKETVPTPKQTPKKVNGANGTPNGRSSARSKKTTSYAELDDFPDDDLEDDADDVFKTAAKVGRRMDDTYKEETDDEDEKAALVTKSSSKADNQVLLKNHEQDADEDGDIDMKQTDPDQDFVVPDEDEEIVENKPAKKMTGKKRKSTALDDEDDLEIEPAKPSKKKTSPAKKASPVKKQKKEEKQDSADMKAIFDSIPTIEPPPPPPKSANGDGKANYKYGQHANSAVPAGAIDTSQLPQGEENCLSGLSFVFTGQLATLGREQGQQLVKQYGGKVMTAPSKKTSYVVLGEDAGPKKLQTIKDHKLKVIAQPVARSRCFLDKCWRNGRHLLYQPRAEPLQQVVASESGVPCQRASAGRLDEMPGAGSDMKHMNQSQWIDTHVDSCLYT